MNKGAETFLKNGKLGYSEREVDALMSEVNDPERITLYCGVHNYFPDLMKAPLHAKCQECWQAYLILFLGSMPPHLRDQISDSLQEFAHKTVENPLGYVPYEHPEITIEKG